MSSQGRGELTARVAEKAKELMGREIDTAELRLMAYLVYVMMNEQRMDADHLNGDDIAVLNNWFIEDRLGTNQEGKLIITKEFWDIVSELMYLGYVDLHKEEEEDNGSKEE